MRLSARQRGLVFLALLKREPQCCITCKKFHDKTCSSVFWGISRERVTFGKLEEYCKKQRVRTKLEYIGSGCRGESGWISVR